MNQLIAMASKVGMTFSKLRPALPYLSQKSRKQIIMSKVKPIALYGVQLMLGQSQHIQYKAETILMNINRWMTTNPEGLRCKNAL